MDNWTFWPRTAMGDPDLRKFVEARGGYWVEGKPFCQGVLERGRATVYLSRHDAMREEFDGQFVELERSLGPKPASWIDIEIGHGPGSEELAQDLVHGLEATWNGLVDKHEPEKAKDR